MTAVYQPSLYEAQVMPAHNGTPTSAAAAAQALPSVTPQTLQVLALLAKRGAYGATQDEAAGRAGHRTVVFVCAVQRRCRLKAALDRANDQHASNALRQGGGGLRDHGCWSGALGEGV
jgi:hypothetical protein